MIEKKCDKESKCDSKVKADKKHARDVFKLFLLKDAKFSKENEFPMLEPVGIEVAHPKALISFSAAMNRNCKNYNCFVHFYEDDFRFQRIWNNPRKYLSKLKKFDGVIMPDFSTSLDFIKPLKFISAYRNQALAVWFQNNGMIVVGNARYEPKCDFLLEGLPKHTVIAICGRACTKRIKDRRCFVRDVKATVDKLEPSAIIYYGSDYYNVMDYPRSLGIPVWMYHGCKRGELDGGISGQFE